MNRLDHKRGHLVFFAILFSFSLIRAQISEGKTRKEADGTLARWCMVQGAVDNDYAEPVLMSYPANYNHPEPLRIWPENQYDRGDMFANFSPTENKDWLLEPGKSYTQSTGCLFSMENLPKRKQNVRGSILRTHQL